MITRKKCAADVSQFFGNFRIVRERSKTLILALIPFFAMILTTVLSSVYRDYLEVADRKFAANVVVTDEETGLRFYGKETSTQRFFSNGGLILLNLLQVVALVIVFLCISLSRIFRTKKLYKRPSIYLHILIPNLFYFVVSTSLNLILKTIYLRPRPYQIKEYGVRTADNLCYYPYVKVYDLSQRKTISKLGCFSVSDTSSFPSGHVGTVAQSLIAVAIVLNYFFNLLNEQAARSPNLKNSTKRVYKVLHVIIVPLSWAMYIVLSVLMCSARITAGKHFFSDVINGFIYGSGTVFSMVLFSPSERHVIEQLNMGYMFSLSELPVSNDVNNSYKFEASNPDLAENDLALNSMDMLI